MSLFKRKSKDVPAPKQDENVVTDQITDAMRKKWNNLGINRWTSYMYQGEQVVTFVTAIELNSKAIANEDRIARILREADKELFTNEGSKKDIYTSIERNNYVLLQSHPADVEGADQISANYAFIKASVMDKLKNNGYIQNVTDNDPGIGNLYLPFVSAHEGRLQPKSSYAYFKATKLRT